VLAEQAPEQAPEEAERARPNHPRRIRAKDSSHHPDPGSATVPDSHTNPCPQHETGPDHRPAPGPSLRPFQPGGIQCGKKSRQRPGAYEGWIRCQRCVDSQGSELLFWAACGTQAATRIDSESPRIRRKWRRTHRMRGGPAFFCYFRGWAPSKWNLILNPVCITGPVHCRDLGTLPRLWPPARCLQSVHNLLRFEFALQCHPA
jgi:hypothetical protein